MGEEDEFDESIDEADEAHELFDGVEDAEAKSKGDLRGRSAAAEAGISPEQQGSQPVQDNPPDIQPFLENLEEITGLVREWFEQSRESKKVAARHQQIIVGIAALTFLIVIGLSALMTFNDALSGDAFTFVLGTLFGAILTFLQNMLDGSE